LLLVVAEHVLDDLLAVGRIDVGNVVWAAHASESPL
jgi:hypothetical protein